MPELKQPNQTPADNARGQTWRYYNEVIEKFRKLCHSDARLFQQAEDRIRAKRVVAAYEGRDKKAVDPFSIAKQMAEYPLDAEDERQIADLYKRKLAFRDRLCAVLGKKDDEGWDVFYGRCIVRRNVPNLVRQFELMGKA